MEGTPQDRPATDPSEVTELRRAVAVLSREVQALAERTASLALALEALSPAAPGAGRTADPAPDPGADGAEPPGREVQPYRVTVSPVTELALAAVAETALRSLPQVLRVLEVTRSEEEVRFDLELVAGSVLADALQGALPVPFDVASSTEAELVIALRPVWGPAVSA